MRPIINQVFLRKEEISITPTPNSPKEEESQAGEQSRAGLQIQVCLALQAMCFPPLHRAPYGKSSVVCRINTHTPKYSFTEELHHVIKAPVPQG